MSRPVRSLAVAAVLITAVTLGGGDTTGQELVRSQDAVVALFSLQTELAVDLRVLNRLEQRLNQNRRDRNESQYRYRPHAKTAGLAREPGRWMKLRRHAL